MKPDCIENYTKAEIIDNVNAIFHDGGFDDYYVNDDLLYYLQRNALKKATEEEKEAINAYCKAIAKKERFFKKLQKKYDKKPLTKITNIEYKKYIRLSLNVSNLRLKCGKAKKLVKRREGLLFNNDLYIRLKQKNEIVDAIKDIF